MKNLLLLALLLPCAVHSQILGGNASVGGGGGNVYTLLHSTTAVCTSPCSITIPSTGTGHLLYVQASIFANASYITATSGACSGSWFIPVAAQISAFSSGSVSSSYCLSTTSGVTSITITTPNSARVRIWEYSAIGPPSFDVCGTVNNPVAGTSQAGVALTLTSSSDVIIQGSIASANVTAISAPYGNFDNFGGVAEGTADVENTASGAAPTWTMVSGTLVGNACAFK